ncbi:hypothetical protein CCAX7_55490 [Capsulimonas corticalis]|uniref:Uncharacterized protein n=1 Tax=Capsulimonas corticalis TaxID=2219043 RepID=A0A402D0T7_9BACT|nr:hypothetical protein [Capsulimonas corticalis]BDI33498.1 hypothetical protein CCAX7_55490 [Capsulimonas corticalis]
MISAKLERVRLDSIRLPDETPGEFGLVTVIVACPGNAHEVLEKVRETLRIVMGHDAGWPTDEEWLTILPSWFVSQCVSEQAHTPEMMDAWSVDGWVYWFRPEDEDRSWRWWDASVIDADTINIQIEVSDWPFPWGALEWLLLASGATSAEV